MSNDYQSLIRRHEVDTNAKFERLHEAFRVRDHSQRGREEWKRAAAIARAATQFDELLDVFEKGDIAKDLDLRQFAFDYLAVDPQFYRSGYIMDEGASADQKNSPFRQGKGHCKVFAPEAHRDAGTAKLSTHMQAYAAYRYPRLQGCDSRQNSVD